MITRHEGDSKLIVFLLAEIVCLCFLASVLEKKAFSKAYLLYGAHIYSEMMQVTIFQGIAYAVSILF